MSNFILDTGDSNYENASHVGVYSPKQNAHWRKEGRNTCSGTPACSHPFTPCQEKRARFENLGPFLPLHLTRPDLASGANYRICKTHSFPDRIQKLFHPLKFINSVSYFGGETSLYLTFLLSCISL